MKSRPYGKPIAILPSVEDTAEIERLLLAYSPQLQDTLRTAQQQIREGQGISHADFWHEVEIETHTQVETHE